LGSFGKPRIGTMTGRDTLFYSIQIVHKGFHSGKCEGTFTRNLPSVGQMGEPTEIPNPDSCLP